MGRPVVPPIRQRMLPWDGGEISDFKTGEHNIVIPRGYRHLTAISPSRTGCHLLSMTVPSSAHDGEITSVQPKWVHGNGACGRDVKFRGGTSAPFESEITTAQTAATVPLAPSGTPRDLALPAHCSKSIECHLPMTSSQLWKFVLTVDFTLTGDDL